LKNTELLDSWVASGTTFEGFEQAVKNIDTSTRAVELNTSLIELLSVSNHTDERTEFKVYNQAQTTGKSLPASTGLPTESATGAGMSEGLISELQRRSKLVIRASGKIFLTSKGLSRDLGARAYLAGDAIYDPTEERSAYLMSRYAARPNTTIAIIRNGETEHVQKIFAMLSSKYCYIPQHSLCGIISGFEAELGKVKCVSWSVSHTLTEIWVEFPEKAEDIAATYGLAGMPVPGMLLETSDTGDCSISAIATWKTKRRSYSRANCYSRKHSGNFSIEEVNKEIQRNLYTTYTKLPERLCELSLIEVANPQDCIEKVITALKTGAAIGKRRSADLTDAFLSEIDNTAAYTAYDIALMFMDLPSRFDVKDDRFLRVEIEKLAYKAPFANFEKFAVPASRSVVLSPPA